MKKEIGTRVWCNGYEGTIVKLCEWAPAMVEVELARGTVCVNFSGLDPVAVEFDAPGTG